MSFISGVGILAVLLLLVIRYKLLVAKAMLPLGLVVALAYFWIPGLVQSLTAKVVEKVGLSNIERIVVEDKWPTIRTVYGQLESYTLVIGYPRLAGDGVGGDFGFLSFLKLNGVFGFSLLFLMVLSRVNRFNGLPLIFIIGTSAHYSSLFYLPGQMIFGLLLSIDKKGLPDSNRVIR